MIDVLMVGCGEYTVGTPDDGGGASTGTDKRMGVVALAMVDLKARGVVG